MENDYGKIKNISIWEKYTLTIDEAAVYFRVGENKIQKLFLKNRTQILFCEMVTVHRSRERNLRISLIKQMQYSLHIGDRQRRI